ncbi:S8 family serine peptidase [Actinoallomurus sp. CA-150999]|uniref:S8 family serine peptidase n=1 Tax=Actinoallomurus sp. CA-150999 TaxID=3239887 RepID=UPI003D93C0AE
MSKIWPVTRGDGVTVAVLDTGVNARLPELADAVLRGGDTTGSGTDGRKDLDDEDDGHGTAMAALIAARPRADGFVGVAPEAHVLPVQVSGSPTSDAHTALVRGIRFAADHGAQVISMSVGLDGDTVPNHCPDDIQAAIAYAARRDIVVVAAAGNSGDELNDHEYPAACAGVVAVGAVDSDNRPWAKTQRQDYVTVAAPGVHIGWLAASGKYYPNGWGTSQATALTAAGVALVRSTNRTMSARTVVQRMIATANPTADTLPDSRTGYGVFRIHRALDTAGFPVRADSPNPVYQRLDQWMARQRASASPRSNEQQGKEKSHHSLSAMYKYSAVSALVVAMIGVSVGIYFRRRVAG